VKVVIGSDHAGFELKMVVREYLRGLGFDVMDVGTDSTAPVDYPDFALRVGKAVRDGVAERGVLICGSGIGASVAANKIDGIRAGLAHDHYSAHQGVEHDDMNVIVFGSRVIGLETAKELAHAFLDAQFTREERHVRRLAEVKRIEETHGLSDGKR
jgi:RpiB/LacA/LacB family sugar-phosphate isomerase